MEIKRIEFEEQYFQDAAVRLLAFSAHLEKKPPSMTPPKPEYLTNSLVMILSGYRNAGMYTDGEIKKILYDTREHFSRSAGPTRGNATE